MGKIKEKLNLSYWEKSTFFDSIDVAIIGSGIVGLSAAIYLKENHHFNKVIILERGPLPMGASTRNAGFACFGSSTEILDDLSTNNSDEVWQLIEMRCKGFQNLRKKFGDNNIGFQQLGGYELFRPEEIDTYNECLSAIPEFNKLLKEITGIPNTFMPSSYKIKQFGFKGVSNLIFNQYEGQIHTGLLMKNMLRHAQKLGVEIYNGVKVNSVTTNGQIVEIQTPSWSIFTQKALIATNGFAKNLVKNLDVQPARNQVLITDPIPNLKIKGTFHYDRGYYYFRNIDNRIMLGGGRNLAVENERTDEFGTTPLIRAALIKILRENVLPDQSVRISNWWSGIMGVGKTKFPIIKEINPNVFAAIRLGGMGVSIGNLIGEKAAKLISEKGA